MENFRVAVKAFIVNPNDELLIIKRRENDEHKPGEWDIPGGRLELGENPFDGLKREAKEEIGLDIDILNPLRVHHFTREDEQKITMLVFLCKPYSGEVKLSEEHTEYAWTPMGRAKDKLTKEFHEEVEIYTRHFSKHF